MAQITATTRVFGQDTEAILDGSPKPAGSSPIPMISLSRRANDRPSARRRPRQIAVPAKRTFYEFFAGGGMAAAGMGAGWTCLFANDFDKMKCGVYSSNWGGAHLHVGDVAALTTDDLPGTADLAWASFPCQDLSLAGASAGLGGNRSGTFWPFWRLVSGLKAAGRAPKIVILENVYGAITSNGGRDFKAIIEALMSEGYSAGPMVVDAAMFLPQSRPRLFIVAILDGTNIPSSLVSDFPIPEWHPDALIKATQMLSAASAKRLLWWALPLPTARPKKLSDIMEVTPTGVAWHTVDETEQLLGMMSNTNLNKVRKAKLLSRETNKLVVGTIYRRTRTEAGAKVQRAEVRFDDVAGCLRTPSGGSSRQIVMIVSGGAVKTRLLSTREAARLMGLSDSYKLPGNYNDAYHIAGDGVVVPVVRHLVRSIAEPILDAN